VPDADFPCSFLLPRLAVLGRAALVTETLALRQQIIVLITGCPVTPY
jgi:hypothetical protein